MNLVIDTTALDKSSAAVTAIGNPTPVTDLQELTVGDNEPMQVTFTAGAAGAPTWAGQTGYFTTVGIGMLDVDGLANYCSTVLSTPVTAGWSGSLSLNTQQLYDNLKFQVGSAVDWTRFPTNTRVPYARPNGAWMSMQVTVTDPTGNVVTYADLRFFLRVRVLPSGAGTTGTGSILLAGTLIPVVVPTSSTLATGTYTIVRSSANTTQTLPINPAIGQAVFVKNQGAGIVTVAAASAVIFDVAPVSTYLLGGTGAGTMLTWDGTYWSVDDADADAPGVSITYTGTPAVPIVVTVDPSNIVIPAATVSGAATYVQVSPEWKGSCSYSEVGAGVGNSITAISFNDLVNGGSMALTNCMDLVTASFPNLLNVDLLNLTTMPSLTTVSVPSLVNVNGYSTTALDFNGLTALTSLSFPSLITVNGSFIVNSNTSLNSLSVPLLTNVGNSISISGDTPLTGASFPSLTNVGNTLTVTPTAALTTFSFPSLVTVGNALTVVLTSVGAIPSGLISFPSLLQVYMAITFNGNNANFTSLSFPALTGCTGLLVNGATSLSSFSAPNLNIIGLSTTAGNLQFTSTALTSLSLPLLASINGGLAITSNASLTSISFPDLTFVGSTTFSIGTNASLTSISFPALSVTYGLFNFATMAACTSISFPVLNSQNTAGTITFSAMASLTTVSFAAMAAWQATTITCTTGMGSITSFIFGVVGTLKQAPKTINITGQALTATSVNQILNVLVSLNGTGGTTAWGASGWTLNLSGGTSSAPTGQGITDKATLVGRGGSITTN